MTPTTLSPITASPLKTWYAEDDQVEEVYERETPLIGAMLEDIEREGQALTAAEQETGDCHFVAHDPG